MRLGKFYVQADINTEQGVSGMRAAQEGCAVLRSKFLPWRKGFEVIAVHPDFDNINEAEMSPEYRCIMHISVDGTVSRQSFERIAA